jgi:hypothetical protein
MSTINEMVANDRTVRFTHYQNGELWYVTETGFSFPVPVAEVGDAALPAVDRALRYMSYIRRHLQNKHGWIAGSFIKLSGPKHSVSRPRYL